MRASASRQSPGSRRSEGRLPSDRPPTFVWLVTATLGLFLALSAVIFPQFLVPDERFHADMVLVAQDVHRWTSDGWPNLGDRDLAPEIAVTSRYIRSPEKTSDKAMPRAERRPFEAYSEEIVDAPENRMAQHPPLYYLVVGGVSAVIGHLLPAELSFDQEILLWRMLSALMVAPLPLFVFAVARLLTPDRWAQLGAVVLSVAIPGLVIRNGPMINNDNLMLLLASVVLLLLLRVAREEAAWSASTGVGVATGLAMLTKGFGLLLLVVVGLLYALAVWRRRARAWRVPLGQGLLAGGTALIIGGWWWLRNIFVYGAIRPQAVPREPVTDFVPDWAVWLEQAIWRSGGSFWGGSYVMRTVDYRFLMGSLIVVTLLGVVLAFMLHRRRGLMLLALLPTGVLLAGVYLSSMRRYAVYDSFAGLQGRYFYAGLAGLLPVLAVGWTSALRRHARWFPAGVALGAGALYLIAVGSVLRRLWGDSYDLAISWDALLAWAPLPAVGIYGLAALAVCAYALVLFNALQLGLSAGRSEVEESSCLFAQPSDDAAAH